MKENYLFKDIKNFLEEKKLRKIYYKIGEVSELTDLPPHVIRFWEKEFPQLSPRKTSSGHRIYSQKDIQTIMLIKELLYENKFTIKGAKELIESNQIENIMKGQRGEQSLKSSKFDTKNFLKRLKSVLSILQKTPPC
jgi:DNA-binding transcriptional MerR regulator